MRDALAERLLAEVMEWTPEDIARERPILQALALYKYDEYQQFSPGMRFIESLARWLGQFASAQERRTAYDFVRSQLVFISADEVRHLVSTAYPDHIRRLLLEEAGKSMGVAPWQVRHISESSAFRALQRQTLFLGLSDGARTDAFRRANPELSNEQVLQTYDGTADRTPDLLAKLAADLSGLDTTSGESPPRFRTLVLLDDFSGSGITYLRQEAEGEIAGKLAKVHRSIMSDDLGQLVDVGRCRVLLVIYVGTEQARAHVRTLWNTLSGKDGIPLDILILQELGPSTRLIRGSADPLVPLIEQYYDSSIEDDHTRKGGADVRYGFADCGLTVVLSHNTPNNSLPLLWADTKSVRALFPRVSRHR